MTSKQALYDLIDEIKYTHSDGVSLTPFDKKRIDIIAKDLEVIEMIKSRIKEVFIKSGCVFDNIEDDNYFHLKFGLTGKEYKKIKEWLGNDK